MRKPSRITIAAARFVAHPPERVYAFLANLENHRHLGDRHLRLERLAPDRSGGQIAIRGPLGLRRTATATVTTARRPRRFGGVIAVGRRSRARTHWTIRPQDGGATVALEAAVVAAGLLDTVLLSLGGRRWLRRRFGRVLASLADALDA